MTPDFRERIQALTTFQGDAASLLEEMASLLAEANERTNPRGINIRLVVAALRMRAGMKRSTGDFVSARGDEGIAALLAQAYLGE